MWRDYAQSIIFALPDDSQVNGRLAFDRLPWRVGAQAEAGLAAWRRGRTGYPVVDAASKHDWTRPIDSA